METVTALTPPSFQRFAIKDGSRIERFVMFIYTPIRLLLRYIGAFRWQDNPSRALTGRAKVLWEEANRRGIEMKQLVLFGKPVEFYAAYVRAQWHYFDALPIVPEMRGSSYAWMDDKFTLKKFLSKSQIPVPLGDVAWHRKKALRIFDSLRKPVIVKPRFGSHGRHSITNISTREQCSSAVSIASKLCQCVVVEEHLRGSVYRATYVNGKVLGILRGDPPRIVGNGDSSIRELIEAKNMSRPSRVAAFSIDEKFEDFMRRQNLHLDSVLPKGTRIDLSEKVGLSYGGYTAEVIEKTHPKILQVLTRAGDLLKAPVVGFDFIIEDIERDPDQLVWGIIEANSQPFIDLHYNPLEGETKNIAAAIWDLWDTQLK